MDSTELELDLTSLHIAPPASSSDAGAGASDSDSDSEDDGVLLGFVEKPPNPRAILRHHFPSKAGGSPAWLDPDALPSAAARACGVCGDPLQLLLQVYAPITDKEYAFHRTLFVFMCPSMGCLLRDQHEQWKRGERGVGRSVKVFRCQLRQENAFYSSEPPRRDGTDKPLTAGAALCSWCGTWKGEKVCSSCRRTRYCSEKHQAMHWRLGHKKECHQIISPSEAPLFTLGNCREKIPVPDKAACHTLWPEYEIVIEEEWVSDSETTEDISSSTSLALKQDEQDEVFESLTDKFEADDDKKCWASFQERIAKAPNQVLRYRRDTISKPLWPLSVGQPSKADIPRCNYCKGPLCYEFQIMPQLLYYFGVKNDPDSLDWGTIAVYSCLASCEASVSYKEEFVWVQLYSPASTT